MRPDLSTAPKHLADAVSEGLKTLDEAITQLRAQKKENSFITGERLRDLQETAERELYSRFSKELTKSLFKQPNPDAE
jgi:hypothetical protein